MITAIHLPARGLRSSTATRANPLMGPLPDFSNVRSIVTYLDVERSQRYTPAAGQTFCNIYAYDVCYLAGVFLPRVWWTVEAEVAQRHGLTVTPKYGETILELNANALHSWMSACGSNFGWTKVDSLDDLQSKANAGQVCVITGQRRDRTRSGHIVCVIAEGPESARSEGGHCVVPLQSQAGLHNYRASTAPGRWWESPNFSAYGYWSIPRPSKTALAPTA